MTTVIMKCSAHPESQEKHVKTTYASTILQLVLVSTPQTHKTCHC